MAKSWDELIDDLKGGSVVALSRLISRVETRQHGWLEAMQEIYAIDGKDGKARITGITGTPGAGKSTLTGEIALDLAKKGLTVGIIAIDPSSPFSGGALLGDRVRMDKLSGVEGIYMRSMATRGALGGLNQATRDVTRIMSAFGFDHILIETVGVGQDEVDIVRAADLVHVVCVPGQGDEIQAIKSGVMEIADIFVINKADLDGAKTLVRQIKQTLHLKMKPGRKTPEVMQTVASRGEGIPELVTKTLDLLQTKDKQNARSEERIKDELTELLNRELTTLIATNWQKNGTLEKHIHQIQSGNTDPYKIIKKTLKPLEGLFKDES